jgi:hypothetical protein
MNDRIQELAEQAKEYARGFNYQHEVFEKKFAQLIVKECIDIAKNWEDELENFDLIEESNSVGIVAYRIARQFGVKE